MRVRLRADPPFPQPYVDGEAEHAPMVGRKFRLDVRQPARRTFHFKVGPVVEVGNGYFVTAAGVKYEIELLNREQVADLRRRARRLGRT